MKVFNLFLLITTICLALLIKNLNAQYSAVMYDAADGSAMSASVGGPSMGASFNGGSYMGASSKSGSSKRGSYVGGSNVIIGKKPKSSIYTTGAKTYMDDGEGSVMMVNDNGDNVMMDKASGSYMSFSG
ncbi:uncharacterized protein LOC119609329 [Lucilia sericata]|uniref:uncharacterized protein LOC119609329 n=1 Tax=Lucilia sericata TaxID=13632 RepID=UPI0018A861FE|nr:uncharacterized protein LOC119609329 [Lucilia sericata]